MRGGVTEDLGKHDAERRIVKRPLRVQDALHLRVAPDPSHPENEQDQNEKARARRNEEAPAVGRVVLEPLQERAVLEFFEDWSEARREKWFHSEVAASHPRIAETIPLTASIMPEGMTFLVLRKRRPNITVSPSDTRTARR